MTDEKKPGRKPNDPGISEWNGSALRAHRIVSGHTLKTLGAAVGAGESALSRWERGERSPDAATVEKLAEVLQCEMESFSKPPTLR